MKRTIAVLTGLALAVALSAVAGAEGSARPAKAKSKRVKGEVSASAKVTPAPESGEEAEPLDAEDAEGTPPTHSIRVLENPYDISSFYRSEGSGGGLFMDGPAPVDERYPIAGFYRQDGGQGPYSIAGYYRQGGGGQGPYSIAGYYRQGGGQGRYPIASFYRQGGGRGAYGSFWNSGYGGRSRARVFVGYRRSIGDNGDLFLVAPFLAPVGSLSGAFNR